MCYLIFVNNEFIFKLGDGKNGQRFSVNSLKFATNKSDMENESNYTDRSSAPLNVNAKKPGQKQDLNASGV